MPTYDYMCETCNEVFSVEQSINDDAGAVCTKCPTWSNNRLISGGGTFILKGGGWAADNYSSSGGSSNNS